MKELKFLFSEAWKEAKSNPKESLYISSIKAFLDIGNEAYEHANARVFLNDPSNTTFRTTIGGVGQTIRSNTEIQTHEFAGLIQNTTAVTGFQLFMGNGNIDNAIVKLYGIS